MPDPWKSKAILTDQNGKPIPQIWDSVAGEFVPAEGKVTVEESALPTGAATSGNQNTGNAALADIKAAVEGTVDVQVIGSDAAVHESLTVDATVGGKAFTTAGANRYAFITCETAQVRFTTNGTAPTTTVGHLLNPGDILKLDSNADIAAFRAIRTGSVSGVLKATFSGVA